MFATRKPMEKTERFPNIHPDNDPCPRKLLTKPEREREGTSHCWNKWEPVDRSQLDPPSTTLPFKIDLKGTHHHISYISICQLKYFLGKAVGAALGVEGLPVNLELQVWIWLLLFFAACRLQVWPKQFYCNKNASSRKVRESELDSLVWSGLVWSGCHIWYPWTPCFSKI